MKDINLLLKEEKNAQAAQSTEAEENVQANEGGAANVIKRFLVLILVAAFVVVTLVVPKAYVGVLNVKLSSLEKELSNPKYAEVKEVNRNLANVNLELKNKEEIINDIDNLNYPVGSIMNTVKNNIPQGCTIGSMECDASTLKITISVSNISNLAEFLLNMEKINYIHLSDSSNNLKLNSTGEYSFSFDLGAETAGKEAE